MCACRICFDGCREGRQKEAGLRTTYVRTVLDAEHSGT